MSAPTYPFTYFRRYSVLADPNLLNPSFDWRIPDRYTHQPAPTFDDPAIVQNIEQRRGRCWRVWRGAWRRRHV